MDSDYVSSFKDFRRAVENLVYAHRCLVAPMDFTLWENSHNVQ